MRRPSLRESFRRSLQVSVVAPLALTACVPDTTGYVAPQCESGLLSPQGVTPAVIPDVMQLRAFNLFGGPGGDRDAGTISPFGAVGEACKTASDKPVCLSSYENLRPTSGFAAECFQLCIDYHLATTRGDEVKAVASLEQLKAFFGPIDTAQEAMFIAFANGYRIMCGQLDRGAAKPNGTGWDVIAEKGIACGAGTAVTRHYLRVTAEGELTEERAEIIERGADNCAIGRRPPGLRSRGGSACDEATGRFFAEAAHLEAASVPAFEQLFAELVALDAPEALRRATMLSALEEIDHTRRTAQLARRFGAEPVEPRVEARPLRTAVELACDNVVEGCVRETYGALVAQHQALHAEDAEVRATMAQIADDETRHAELSWEIAAWLDERLTDDERARVEQARVAAVAQLRRELEAPVDAALMRTAGLPSSAVAVSMFEVLSSSLGA